MDDHVVREAAARAADRWPDVLSVEFEKEYFPRLADLLASQRRAGHVLPEPDKVFAAFEATALDEVKVVVLGQDPYPDEKRATGLAFSTPPDIESLSMSLHSISASLEAEGFAALENGDLRGWTRSGVLLLNTSLTIRTTAVDGSKASFSHAEDWRPFTEAVLTSLAERDETIVFVLWGGQAQQFAGLVERPQHTVVRAVHPAAPGRREQFVAARSFTGVNEALRAAGKEGIDWGVRQS